MEIISHIIKYLEQYNRIAVPFWGVFSVENSQAQYNAETKSFLPPKQEVFFTENFDIQNNDFLNFVAKQEKKSIEEVKLILEKEIKAWNTELSSKGEIKLPGLGTFQKNENNLLFISSFIPKYMPEDFGLEEVQLKHLKRKFGSKKENKSSFGKILLWTILILIIITLVYLGIEKKDFLLQTMDNIIYPNSKK